jgi:hypothetical protein
VSATWSSFVRMPTSRIAVPSTSIAIASAADPITAVTPRRSAGPGGPTHRHQVAPELNASYARRASSADSLKIAITTKASSLWNSGARARERRSGCWS